MKRLTVALILSVIILCSLPVNSSDACIDVQQSCQSDMAEISYGDVGYVVVYYDAKGGTCSKAFDTVKVGDSITLPGAERSGYNLKCWVNASGALLSDPSGVPYYNHAGDTVSPKDNVYLVAVWEEKTIYDTAGEIVNSVNPVIIGAIVIAVIVLAAVVLIFKKK